MLLVIVCGAPARRRRGPVRRWGREPLVEPRSPDRRPRRAAPTTSREQPPPRRRTPPLRLVGLDARSSSAPPRASWSRAAGRATRHATARRHLARGDAVGSRRRRRRSGRSRSRARSAHLVFGALPFAFASTALFLLAAPWLPRGRLAGPTFGLARVHHAWRRSSTRVRADNVDFDIVGPRVAARCSCSRRSPWCRARSSPRSPGGLSRSLPLMTRANWPDPPCPSCCAVVLVPLGAVLAVGAASSRSPFPASCRGSSPSAPRAAG